MSTNAARRVSPQPEPRREAAILRLPVAGRHGAAAEQGAEPARAVAGAAASRGDLVTPALLAVLLVLVCLAWEALSGGL